MRILQVIPDPYQEVGGVVAHVRNISEGLAHKHDVTVYATNRGLKYRRFETRNGVKVERFNCYAPGNAYYLSVEMLLKLRQVEFDIVHGHSYHALPLHFAHLAKADKFVVTPHFHGVGHSTYRNSIVKLLKPFGKRTLERADRIIAVSEYEKSLIADQFGICADSITVIPNGVDFKEFLGLKRRNRGFRSILYVGYLIDFKGPQYLVEVLPKLDEDVILEIVGRGPLRPYLEKRAHELKVHRRVRFYEDLPRRDLVQRYADADVFVLLSQYEAYSIVVAEALAAGTPCIVAKASALEEWVDSNTCLGINYPISLEELEDKVNFILSHGHSDRDIEKWRGSKILDWTEVTSRTEEVYLR